MMDQDSMFDTVTRCCAKPSQHAMDDGARTLAEHPADLVRFVRNRGAYLATIYPQCDLVWLWSTAFAWAADTETRADRVEILSRWLLDPDSSVRESAANALGGMVAAEARPAILEAWVGETDASVREAMWDAINDID